ncbi:hypothetical protein ACL02T_12640 [Pseudonocardia sp. RS010]|uniref:hypothetical protein n=1 Tax=Pseudonocardia sp. RS010 TaxID=3385979 RepID=UPI0039A14F2B
MSTARTDALRDGAALPARMSAAHRDGEATAQAREPRRNPWRGDAETAVERVLAVMWAKGFSAGNPFRLEPIEA